MIYLFALPGVTLPGVPADYIQASEHEPVVPWFPAPPQNAFLGTDSWKLVSHALALDRPVDPDVIASRLAKQYPGLPRVLLDNYVLATARAASKLPLDTIVSCIVTADAATLQISESGQSIVLWDQQPIK